MMRPYPSGPIDDGPLYGDRALQRLRHAAEGRHEPVTHGLDLRAAVGAQALARYALVLPQDLAGLGVAEPLRHRCGALDVGEQDCVYVAWCQAVLRRRTAEEFGPGAAQLVRMVRVCAFDRHHASV